MKFRDKLYRQLLTTDPDSDLYSTHTINLKSYNAILNKSIRHAKQHYYANLFDRHKSDIKKTWNSINQILHKTKQPKEIPKYLNIGQERVENDYEIAVKFNDFFVNIGPTLSSKINNTSHKNFTSYLRHDIQHTFTFTPVEPEQTRKVLQELAPKSSCGHDDISSRLLKEIAPYITNTLTLIINQSLSSGIFPNRLKIAKVVPLYKKGDSHIIDNYRPISLLPSISKIFEKIVFKQLYDYFLTKKLLYNSQYGFRKDHSTEFASLELVDKVTQDLDQGKIPIALFLDLSKAFDTLDHDILLYKLNYYGIRDMSLNWFSSYLTQRQQYVEINGEKSPSLLISTGVPQGSILGPLLFLIYMNDIHLASDIFHSILYADDTTLQTPLCAFKIPFTISQKHNLSSKINAELSKIQQWLEINKLSLNISKTKFMVFHRRQRDISNLIPELEINGIRLEHVTEFNFLGLIIDQHLNWKPHIDKVSSKIARSVGVLNRLKRFLPANILRTVYNAMILPHLQYGILCWGHNLSRLRKLQKKAIRAVSHKKYNAHTEPIFKDLNLLNIDDIFSYFKLKFYYKLQNQLLPNYFLHMFPLNSDIHDHSTRQAHNLHHAKSNTASGSNCIRIYLPKFIEQAPEIITDKVQTHSYDGFSKYAKHHFINRYDPTCRLANCYICKS